MIETTDLHKGRAGVIVPHGVLYTHYILRD